MKVTAKIPISETYNVQKIRRDFPILNSTMHGKPLVFLDNAASSQKPRQVIDSITKYYESQHANVHRGVYALSAAATDAFEAAREAVCKFIHAKSVSEIVFTSGATEAINLVASTFGKKYLKPGDEILISAMEHHSNIVPWQIICAQYGAHVKVAPITDEGECRIQDINKNITEKTRLIAITHISNTLGTKNPVRDMITLAHKKGIPVLVDGAQAAPHLPLNMQELDADFYAFSGHKMFGPTGIGVLYGKESWLEKLPPYQGGGEMIKSVSFEKTTFNELPFKFEAGTPNIAGVIGLHAAIKYIQSLPGPKVMKHEQELLESATALLSKIEGLRIIGTASEKASVLSFIVDGIHPYDIGTLLDHQGIAVRTGHHCTEPLMERFQIPGTVRASFSIYNTLEEVEILYSALRKAINMLK